MFHMTCLDPLAPESARGLHPSYKISSAGDPQSLQTNILNSILRYSTHFTNCDGHAGPLLTQNCVEYDMQ